MISNVVVIIHVPIEFLFQYIILGLILWIEFFLLLHLFTAAQPSLYEYQKFYVNWLTFFFGT